MSEPTKPDPTPPEKPPLPLEYRKPIPATGLTGLQIVARILLAMVGVVAVLFLVLLGTCALMR